ncbi:MAG: bifunctional adenosylcobinamide kinase/adenosylcobinamide-phosphate guanylyltransferase [Eubacterium sp.]
MHYFIGGGAKSGKSMRAQRIARKMAEEKRVPMYYLAVMDPQDEEDLERIRGHRKAREGWGFQTLEESYDIPRVLETADADGVFLLDSVTALLANVMFRGGQISQTAGDEVLQQLLTFADRTENTIFVSDNVFSDAALYDPVTEAYRRAMGRIGIALAERCGIVEEVSAGIVKRWKG